MRFAITCASHNSPFPDVGFFPELSSAFIYLLTCSAATLQRCVLEVLVISPPPAAFSLLCHPFTTPPPLTVGRFSNIHYFHQGQCNTTGSAKDLAGADKGLAPDTVIT